MEKIRGLYGHNEARARWFRDQFRHPNTADNKRNPDHMPPPRWAVIIQQTEPPCE